MTIDRRDFMKTGFAGAGLGALVSSGLTTGLLAGTASADAHGASSLAGTEASEQALADLRAVLARIDAGFADPVWRISTPGDLADARRSVMHALQHALEIFLEGDRARPNFKRFVTPEKKLLGDNPDAIYHHAWVDAEHSYRIRGNLADATYTSFTVERGTAEGGMSTGVGATLNDTQFETDADGNFEIIVSAKKQPGNWLELAPDAGSISTRHYYEREVGVAADRMHHIPLVIEPLKALPPPKRAGDAELAAALGRVGRFLETTIQPFGGGTMPKYVSRVPNQFPQPSRQSHDNTDTGYAAVDNVYSMAPFVVKPGEALVVRGRFPKCRFASVVLWNRYLQTLDYANRRTSLNRKQTRLERDGSFKIVIADRDPGVPNWIDTEGRPFGMVFWRFLLPEEDIAPLVTNVVPIGDAAELDLDAALFSAHPRAGGLASR
ncbi:MAG: DUF1214 domain-containing protein [Myxococcota bacterium]|nr:DUF1214 domain-containing protein [Myxococcota bacterium]